MCSYADFAVRKPRRRHLPFHFMFLGRLVSSSGSPGAISTPPMYVEHLSFKERLLIDHQPDDDYLTEDEKAQLKRKVRQRLAPCLY